MSNASKTRESAAAYAESVAFDDAHGYDQGNRWGNPDYDCSWLTIDSYKRAGVSLTCTYTGNMRPDMLSHGFRDVTKEINLATGAGLKRGDVLLHETHHTAIYTGNGKLVNAGGNELGKATGGKPGDQTGKEIRVMNYYNFPWQYVLRYYGKDSGSPSSPASDAVSGDEYTVQSGDTLSAIAQRMGVSLVDLARVNGISNVNLIFPGTVLRRPGAAAPAADPQRVSVDLPALSKGASGHAVKALQSLLLNAGIDVGPSGIDGDFGEATWVAVCDFQRARGVSVDGVVSGPIWTALIG